MAGGRTIRVGRKCYELREQRKSWAEIANILPSLGTAYLMESGEPYSPSALSSLYSNNKSEILSSYERDERNEDKPQDELSGIVKGFVQEFLDLQLPKIEEAVASRLRRLVQEEILRQSVNSTFFRGEHEHEAGDLPPEPKARKEVGTKGKGRLKQDREYVRKTLTIDVNLWNLFEQEMKSRRISSAGRMADIILWHHYGRPNLSYMTESDEPEMGGEEKHRSDEE